MESQGCGDGEAGLSRLNFQPTKVPGAFSLASGGHLASQEGMAH